METKSLERKVNEFLEQKRIAVAGVSRQNNQHPVGDLIYHRLKESGHNVFAVNPNMPSYDGDNCYPNIQSIPGGVDGVVIITRPEITEQIVKDCHEAGVRWVWIHEGMPRKATSVSAGAVEYCTKNNINLIAGACPMMFGSNVDFAHRCMRWVLKFTGRLPT
ncbi:MAG TPA: CoA-binding protein [Chitinophagaceae bacterium]